MAKSSTIPTKAWSSDEHKRFLDALEKYGSGTSGNEWNLMAQEVGTRTYHEVKLHAHKYFLQLQAAAGQRKSSNSAEHSDSNDRWSFEEDVIFENALATYDDTDADRWEKISPIIPGKSVKQLKKRYKKMVEDIARIEAGEIVTVKYSEYTRTTKKIKNSYHQSLSEDTSQSKREDSELKEFPSLTISERQNLINALEDAQQSSLVNVSSSPVSSAVVNLLRSSPTCNSSTPRGRPLIRQETARRAIDMAIKASTNDDRNVFETLLTGLGIEVSASQLGDSYIKSPSLAVSDNCSKNPRTSPKLSLKVHQIPLHTNEKMKLATYNQ